ncbi:hypothetical protein [Rhizobium sp. R693]|uniref:hypothetical protein n=1 Tax=Rhizobium sp. R693 TaxID=1764276 RepID=UPI0011307D4A|nr:hypothetical protein [Rhizobium sp. R693]
MLPAFLSATIAQAADGFGGFEIQRAKGYSYQRSAAPDGTSAERFELRAGDCPPSTGDCHKDRERVEKWESRPASRLDHEYWYHFSEKVTQDTPALLCEKYP